MRFVCDKGEDKGCRQTPIIHPSKEQPEQCRCIFDNLQICIAQTAHYYY